jgi:hypothetical protein
MFKRSSVGRASKRFCGVVTWEVSVGSVVSRLTEEEGIV